MLAFSYYLNFKIKVDIVVIHVLFFFIQSVLCSNLKFTSTVYRTSNYYPICFHLFYKNANIANFVYYEKTRISLMCDATR